MRGSFPLADVPEIDVRQSGPVEYQLSGLHAPDVHHRTTPPMIIGTARGLLPADSSGSRHVGGAEGTVFA